MKTTASKWLYAGLLLAGIILFALSYYEDLPCCKGAFSNIGCGIIASVVVAFSTDIANTKYHDDREEKLANCVLLDIKQSCKRFAHSIIDNFVDNQGQMTFLEALDKALAEQFEISDDEHVSICQGVGLCVINSVNELEIRISAQLNFLKNFMDHDIVRNYIEKINEIIQLAKEIYRNSRIYLMKEASRDVERCKDDVYKLKDLICNVFQDLTDDFEKAQIKSNKLF